MYIACGPSKVVQPARKMPPELERKIERDVAGDVRWTIVAIQPPRQVEPGDVDRALAVPSRHRGVERQLPVHAAPRSIELDVGLETVGWPLERHVERRLDGDVLEASQHTGPFLEREARRSHRQVENRWRPVRTGEDGAGESELRTFGVHLEALEEPAAGPTAESTAERAHRKVGRVADPGDAREIE